MIAMTGLILFILVHLGGQPLGLFPHRLHVPGLAILVPLLGEPATLTAHHVVVYYYLGLGLSQMRPDIPLVALQHLIHLVPATPGIHVPVVARNDVGMHMRHRLAGSAAVLDGNVQGGRPVDALQSARHTLHRQEQVCELGGAQVRQQGHAAEWRY